mgnify:CR=1 FL=1
MLPQRHTNPEAKHFFCIENYEKNLFLFFSSKTARQWQRTFGSKASIPERKAICAAAKATTRLRRICACSCLRSVSNMKAKKKIGLGSIMMLCFYKLVAKLLAHRTHLFGFCGFQAILSSTHLSCPFLCTKLGEERRCCCCVINSLRLLSEFWRKKKWKKFTGGSVG